MRKFVLFLIIALFTLAGFNFIWAQNNFWYKSNKAGFSLERIYSSITALREEYALNIHSIALMEIPEFLHSYHNSSYTIEERILYEKGIEIRRQWIFRDQKGVTRLNASFSADFFLKKNEAPDTNIVQPENGYEEETDDNESGESSETTVVDEEITAEDTSASGDSTGFIEIFNAEQYLTEERSFLSEGSEMITKFTYGNNVLLKSQTWKKNNDPPDDTGNELVLQYEDSYRYTRANSLRAVERRYFETAAEEKNRTTLSFPALRSGKIPMIEFGQPYMPFGLGSDDDFEVPQGNTVTYITDNRGRALREIRRDEEGNIVGEVDNTWSGDRLVTVKIAAAGEEILMEFDYDDDGNRTMERNFKNGVLERTVRSEGDRDIEELYLDGIVILRAYWEGGRKISEERIRSGGRQQR